MNEEPHKGPTMEQLRILRETTKGASAVVKLTTGPTPQKESTDAIVATDALTLPKSSTVKERALMRSGRRGTRP